MATRNGRSTWQVWYVLGLSCLVALATPTTTRGDGSITFDGADSKLVNSGADLLDGEDEITICAWVYRAGAGEGGSGVVFTMDEQGGTGSSVKIINSASLLVFASAFASPGVWTIPFEDNAWSAVAVTYDTSDDDADPTFRINFIDVAEAEPAGPSGTPPTIASGYCVGNLSGGGNTWDGRIAHVQVFNRILTAPEMDACLQAPGSVKSGLRLWLPMTNDTEIVDRSGNGFDGTATALVTSVEGPAITLEPGAVPGITVLSPGYTAVTQLVVPRYANGVSHPAGEVRGQGPMSVVQGTVHDDVSPEPIVVTEDHGNANVNQWTNGSLSLPPVLQPIFRNFTLAGKDDLGNGYGSSGAVNDNPGRWNTDDDDLEHGLYVMASAPKIENVNFFHIAGTCCQITRGGGDLIGALQPFDNEKFRIADCYFHRAFRGVELQTIDGVIGRLAGHALRDYGLKVTSGGGNLQFEGAQHFWGVFSGDRSDPGRCVWFESGAGGCWGGPWYVETSDVGMQIQSSNNRFHEIYSKNCIYGSLLLWGQNNTLTNGLVEVLDTVAAGESAGGNTASTIVLKAAEDSVDDTYNGTVVCITGGQGEGQARTVVDYVGSSDTVHVSPDWSTTPNGDSLYEIYPTEAAASGEVGDTITPTTIEIENDATFQDDSLIGYSIVITGGTGSGQARDITDFVAGTDIVTVSSAWDTNPTTTSTYEIYRQIPSIHFADQYNTLNDFRVVLPPRPTGAPGAIGIRLSSGQGGNATVLDRLRIQGSGTGGKGIGLQATMDLNYTTIRAHVRYLGGGIGIDLLDGTTDRIGTGNTIHITYDPDSGDMTEAEALQRHEDWTYTDDGDGEVNDVRVNGKRLYRDGAN